MNIKWAISQLDRQTANGFVTTAHWNCTATDGEFSASTYSTCGFTIPESTDGLKPYDHITEAEVLSWIWGSGVDKDATESSLAAQIEAQKNPVTATGLPWVQA